MDQIQEFELFKDTMNEQSFTIPKNSHALSARMSPNGDMIIVDVLVDLDNTEMTTKTFRLFNKYSSIDDNMKADFIGTIVDNEGDEVFYVFEKIR